MLFPPELDEEVKAEELRKKSAEEAEKLRCISQKTRARIASLVKLSDDYGLSAPMRGIFKLAQVDLERWKSDGNTDELDRRLTAYAGTRIRSYLDYKLPTGLTIQEFSVDFLRDYN